MPCRSSFATKRSRPPACLPACCCSGKALDCLRHATHVLSTVPPDADNDIDPVIMAHAQQVQRLPMDGWAVGVQLGAALHAASMASGSRAAVVRSLATAAVQSCPAAAQLTPPAAVPLQLSEHADRFKWVGYISSTSGAPGCCLFARHTHTYTLCCL